MSLKNLLAVGESFFGVSTEPSPYEVKKKHQLPVFGAQTTKEEGDQSLLPSAPANEGSNFEQNREARVKISPERSRLQSEPEERRRFLDRRRRPSAREFKQSELSLEQVKVVRNDLSDADLELSPRKAARSVELDLNPFAPRPIAAIGRPAHEKQGWAARMTRLFGFLRRGRP